MKRVTVVDDDEDICRIVQLRLTSMGMAVDAYFDGPSGLEAIAADPPDLAIIDVMMPGMNGLEVTRAIRAQEFTKDLPVVIFSALVSPPDHDAGLEAGADHYIIKPFSVSGFGALVEEILGLRRCTVCGGRLGAHDMESSGEQVSQHTKLGSAVAAYGDICGECLAAAFQRIARLVAATRVE